ncbi:bifunctional diguanylate cyclase/phosphodiesterase [Novosphingobium beihaiensis]|uniref:EAL domain-containing protein n=1 Tax=Novosphingobium beihaiensis TaxID=2930389 RepID=A0ABT0BNA9_9SPHN|nr:EAL domain-containing protein [Novosphingobium beihaiensis]MCJ2186535.1 EAL domain-containing protein [Novosphingobium beihaiensis]
MVLEFLLCIREEHDLRLVLLAVGVSLLSAKLAVLTIRQAGPQQARAARIRAVAGGLVTGFGIWIAHFIALAGFHRSSVSGHGMVMTTGSLLAVLAAMAGAFWIVRTSRARYRMLCASAIAAAGLAVMHYTGAAALEVAGPVRWHLLTLLLSLVVLTVPLYPALSLAEHGKTWLSGALASVIMACAVVGGHFLGMVAMQFPAVEVTPPEEMLLSQPDLAVSGAVSVALLALCYAIWEISRRRAATAASEREFGFLIKGVSDCAIYMLDREGRIANWNAGAQRLKGYTCGEAVGMTLDAFHTQEDREAGLSGKLLAIAQDAGKCDHAGWRVRKDGSRFWADETIERIEDDSGRHLGFAKITRDMTQCKRDQDRIRVTSGNLDAALEHMHHALCLYDSNDRLVLYNRRFLEMWDVTEDSVPPGTPFMQVVETVVEKKTGAKVPQERLDNVRVQLQLALADPNRAPYVSEFNGGFVVATTARALPDGRWVITFEDISERRRSEQQIAHMALHDGLTGLNNRTSFNRWLDREIGQVEQRGQQLALVAIDLDRFNEINDSRGHSEGDAVLQGVADALLGTAHDDEIVARLGGDEFAVAKPFTAHAELVDFVTRINACFAKRDAEEDEGGIGASLGIAIYPADASEREALLNNADLAMKRAKESLSENICYYEPGMDERARHRRQLANDLRHALARDELRILYQPQRSLKTNKVSGYEALLRWHHPRFGLISPAEFIPIAEQTGEIMRIGEWVLRAACAEAVRWKWDGKIAVNLSPVQLLKPDLPERVTNILLETGLSPRRLELEITETAIIADKARALHSLRRIKASGVSVAMDDFGTGYSSLDTLHSFPFDKIKIDKSFLLRAEQSEQAGTIVRAVLALGKSLGIPVLAEGVETESQLALLVREGCDEAQGYYFGKPGEAPSMIAYRASFQ